MKIEFPDLLSHQLEFIEDTSTRHLALCGGYGSGKTLSTALKIIHLSALNAGFEGCALSPTYSMAQRVLIPEIERQLRFTNVPYGYSKSFSQFEIGFGSKSTKIHILSAENYERVAGLNLAFGCFDEMDLMRTDAAYAAWRMVQSRLRRGNVYQMTAASTPEGFKFLYEYFKRDAEGKTDRRIIKAKTRDNPFLPAEYIETLLEDYPPQLAAAYLEGEFVNIFSGAVYPDFDRNVHHVDQTVNDFPNSILHIGVDFNINNMAASVLVIDKGRVFALDEFTGLRDTTSMAKAIRARYPGRPIYIYPDASGKSERSNATTTDISILKEPMFGFQVFFHSKNPRVTDRVGSVNALIKNAKGDIRFFINTNKCKILTGALEQQGYDKNGEPDKTTGVDHILDATGYPIYFRFPIALRGSVRQL